MSDAHNMLRSYFERWQRLEGEKASIAEDLKNLFAEAKGNGFNTKAMRVVFREQIADDADRHAADEHEVICDLYRASLAGAGRAHTRETDFGTTPKASKSEASSAEKVDLVTTPHDPITGEVFEDLPDTKSGRDSQVRDDAFSPSPTGTTVSVSNEPTASSSDAIASANHQSTSAPSAGLSSLPAREIDKAAGPHSNSSEPTSSPVTTDGPDAGAGTRAEQQGSPCGAAAGHRHRKTAVAQIQTRPGGHRGHCSRGACEAQRGGIGPCKARSALGQAPGGNRYGAPA